MGSLNIIPLSPDAVRAALTPRSLEDVVLRKARKLGPVDSLADALALLHVQGGQSREQIHALFQTVVVNYSRKRFAKVPPTPDQVASLAIVAHAHVRQQWRYVALVVRKLNVKSAAIARRQTLRDLQTAGKIRRESFPE